MKEKFYEVRMMYDGTYITKKVKTPSVIKAEELALKYLNTSKEYHIFSITPLYNIKHYDRDKIMRIKKLVYTGRILMLKKDVQDDLRPYGLELKVYPKGTLFKVEYLDDIQIHGHLLLEDGRLPFSLQYGEFTVLKRQKKGAVL